MADRGTGSPLGVPSFSDHLANRVHQLERDLAKTRAQLREMRESRDLWRHRALRKAGLRAA